MFLSFCYIYKYFVRQLKVFPPSFCHFCACEMSPGWGHLITWMDPSVGHLNGILARVGGILNTNFQKSQMPGGLPGRGHVEASIWPIHNSRERKIVTPSHSLVFSIPWGNSFFPHVWCHLVLVNNLRHKLIVKQIFFTESTTATKTVLIRCCCTCNLYSALWKKYLDIKPCIWSWKFWSK